MPELFNFGTPEEVEARVLKAVTAYESGDAVSLAAACKEHYAPYHRAARRLKGIPSKVGHPPTHTKLSEPMEEALLAYIKRCEESGFAAFPSMIHGAAEAILNTGVHPPQLLQRLGRDWVTRWLKRHPELLKQRQKSREKERIDAATYTELSAWYKRFNDTVLRHAILPQDCWNFDETGFRIGCGGSQIVVTFGRGAQLKGESRVAPTQLNRDFVTAVECVNAAGAAIPPLLIMKGKVHLAQWYKETCLPDNYFCSVSETGYSNDYLSLQWLQHFDKYSRQHQLGAWRLLLFDGFGGHTTKEFLEYCDQAKIIPFGLMPHTSQWCQPLDRSAFQPYKWYHKRAVEYAVRSGAHDFNKVEFLYEIKTIREQTFKLKTILSGWRKAGLWPYNPAAVLDIIPREAAERLESPPPDRLPAPTTPSSICRLGRRVLDRANARQKVYLGDVQRLAAGAIKASCELKVAKRDLALVTKQAQRRQKRQQQDLRQVQKGGVLYAKDARNAVLERDEREAAGTKKVVGGNAKVVQAAQVTTAPFEIISWKLPNNVTRH